MTVRLGMLIAFAVTGAAEAMPTADYLAASAADVRYEREASALLLASSRDDRLRDYARLAIADQTRGGGLIRAAAIEAGIAPPRAMLSPYQRAMLAQLAAAQGVDRDMLYVRLQRSAHEAALALELTYSATGDSAPLRAAAAQIIPAVRQHQALLDARPAM